MALFQIQVLIISCVFAVSSQGNNYDGYLASMAARNQEAHELFRQHHPSGGYILDYLTSPNFLRSHQILADDEADEGFGGGEEMDERWSRLLSSLAFAEETAKEPYSVEEIEELFRSRVPWTQNMSIKATEGDKRGKSTMARSMEVAPQNDLWGEHRMSGGSSEVGKWMEYAVYSAHAQDDDDDGDDYDDLNEMSSLAEPTTPARPSESGGDPGQAPVPSGVKLDRLPAYCDPPNPCPVGYRPEILPTPCDRNLPNTKSFNRAWILDKMRKGECSCDEEHMESCPSSSYPLSAKATNPHMNVRNLIKDEDELLNPYTGENPFLHGQKRGSLVAKKTHYISKRGDLHANLMYRFNPYFYGKHLGNVVKKAGHRMQKQSSV